MDQLTAGGYVSGGGGCGGSSSNGFISTGAGLGGGGITSSATIGAGLAGMAGLSGLVGYGPTVGTTTPAGASNATAAVAAAAGYLTDDILLQTNPPSLGGLFDITTLQYGNSDIASSTAMLLGDLQGNKNGSFCPPRNGNMSSG